MPPNQCRIREQLDIREFNWQVLFNEKAGRLSPSRSRKRLEGILLSLDLNYDFISKAGSLDQTLNHLISSGNRHFIIAGGDGSINYFINALYKKPENIKAELFILPFPLGSGNDYCKSLNIKSTKDYLKQKLSLAFEKVSIGRIEYASELNYFINVAGMGFDAETLRYYDKIKSVRIIRGNLGFIFSLLVVLFKYKSQAAILKCDERVISLQLYTVLVGLGKYLGGGLYMCPNADPRHSTFSVTLIEHVSVGKILRNVAKLFNGQIEKVREVEIIECQKVEIIQSKLISQIDGEIKESTLKSLRVQQSGLYLPFIS